MIRFEQVSKRYAEGIDALSGIDLQIGAGEMVLLEGRSGAGKSTLLRLLMAIERPTQGAVLVNGQNVGTMKRRAVPFLRRHIGMVFQDLKLLFDRHALDNVLLPLAIAGVPHKEALRRAQAALDKVGLLGREKALPAALSGGEQQRLAIARAVVNRPTVLLADEPTAHLDSETAEGVMALLGDFHRAGVTVLVAACDARSMRHFNARRIRLEAGRLVS